MPPAHELIFHDRILAGPGDVIILEFRERSFILAIMWRNMPFQHDFRLGGHFEVDGFALHQASRFAQKTPRDLKLVGSIGGGRRGGGVIKRVMTDKDRHRHWLVALLILEIILPGMARIEKDS